ncbi:MAG: hypothetical protein ACXVFI_17535 [Solirubrobacteraceae bacterium]
MKSRRPVEAQRRRDDRRDERANIAARSALTVPGAGVPMAIAPTSARTRALGPAMTWREELSSA